MTMKELAKLASVSVSTVSKAFKEADDISESTREHIFAVARECGCYGKFYKGKYYKKILAVICPELASDFYVGYVEKLQQLIEADGGIVLVSAYHFDYSKQEELIAYYTEYLKVDGVFVIGLAAEPKKACDIPIIALFPNKSVKSDSVNVDFFTPLCEAVELLQKRGHKNIAFFGESLTIGKSNLFLKAINRIDGINGRLIKSNCRFEEAGRECVKIMLEEFPEATAVICAYDNIAVGALKQLKTLGFSVPEDFSVIGIDNMSFSGHLETSLTTIDTGKDEICLIARDLMNKKLKNKFYKSYRSINLNGRLILRESVAEAKTLR